MPTKADLLDYLRDFDFKVIKFTDDHLFDRVCEFLDESRTAFADSRITLDEGKRLATAFIDVINEFKDLLDNPEDHTDDIVNDAMIFFDYVMVKTDIPWVPDWMIEPALRSFVKSQLENSLEGLSD